MKNRAEMLMEKLKLNSVLLKPLQYILITKLLVLRDYNSILVIYDKFSKILHSIATMKKILAKELARVFKDNI